MGVKAEQQVLEGPARVAGAFPVDPAQIAVPALSRLWVPRPRVTALLEAEHARVVQLVAPAGWGKTTALAQWAHQSDRSVA